MFCSPFGFMDACSYTYKIVFCSSYAIAVLKASKSGTPGLFFHLLSAVERN